MPIFALMTLTTKKTIKCSRRALLAAGVGLVLAAGLAGRLHAADEPAKKTGGGNAAASASETAGEGGAVFCHGIRRGDEIDVVNTRSICGVGDSSFMRKNLRFETFAICDDAGDRRWQPLDLDGFLSFDPSVTTIIFVHGNQIAPGDAKNEGLATYRTIILHGCDAPRIRFVIYSWPSSKVGGLLYDVREKAARTEPSGYHLAWLLDQMPVETPIGLVGFSFGARIITGGLHILAGGSLGGTCVLSDHVHPNRAPMNVVLMAAALNSYWLAEGEHHGLAMTEVSRMLLINNCEDRAMRYYDMITPGPGGPQALGLCGPTRISPQSAGKILNRDVSNYVGPEHEYLRYLCAPGDAGMIWDYVRPARVAEVKAGG